MLDVFRAKQELLYTLFLGDSAVTGEKQQTLAQTKSLLNSLKYMVNNGRLKM